MTPTKYVAQKIQELDLLHGLDISRDGHRVALASRILKQIFNTDGVLYERQPSIDTIARFKVPMNFDVPALPRTDFVRLLASYYDELAEKQSPAVAHAWWGRVLDEYSEFMRMKKSEELRALTATT